MINDTVAVAPPLTRPTPRTSDAKFLVAKAHLAESIHQIINRWSWRVGVLLQQATWWWCNSKGVTETLVGAKVENNIIISPHYKCSIKLLKEETQHKNTIGKPFLRLDVILDSINFFIQPERDHGKHNIWWTLQKKDWLILVLILISALLGYRTAGLRVSDVIAVVKKLSIMITSSKGKPDPVSICIKCIVPFYY